MSIFMEMEFQDFVDLCEIMIDEIRANRYEVISEYKEFKYQYICNVVYYTGYHESTVFVTYDLNKGEKKINRRGLLVTDHLKLIERKCDH